MVGDIRNLTREWSRHALPRPNRVYYLWRYGANGARTVRHWLRRPRYSDSRGIAAEIARDGIVVSSTDRLLSPDGVAAFTEAARAILESSRREDVARHIEGASAESLDRRKDYLVHLASFPDGVSPDDSLLKLAVDPKLLEIVAGYLGFWPCLHSMSAWLNFPTAAAPERSQLWHRDPEDVQVVKVFIYLVDVDEQCGPFTYVPATQPFGAKAAVPEKLERSKRTSDDRMKRHFAPAEWRVCTGPPGTMIVADTVGYHRGGKPVEGHRILITFTYTSATPITDRSLRLRAWPRWATTGVQRAALRELLSPPPSPERSRRAAAGPPPGKS